MMVFGSTLVVCSLLLCVAAHDDACYTSGGVAGIVIATIVVTLVTASMAASFIWYLWKQRKDELYAHDEEEGGCVEKSPMDNKLNDYAFDNPYFKDDETDAAKQHTTKGESGFQLDNGNITPSQPPKAPSNGHQQQSKKSSISRPFSSLPFHAVFHPAGKKQRATTDDINIAKHVERVSVPLRGHDFTGLGFNICGNMRDGIFVKDVLHRGPASESGKIKAGDRIVGVTVSFGGMVYEDALTILSYASPYDVKLELEKTPPSSTPPSASSPRRLVGGTSTSFRSCRGLFHPLYRSQSIDDLTQIGKDSGLIQKGSSTAAAKSPKESSAPKRSQSVEASNGGPKSRPSVSLKLADESSKGKGSRKSSTSSCDSASRATTAPEKTLANGHSGPSEECTKKEVKSSRFRVEQINVKSEAPVLPTRQAPPAKPARDNSLERRIQDDCPGEKQRDAPSKEEESGAVAEEVDAVEKQHPQAPPRKSNGTPAKRRAPAPPPAHTSSTTAADVHRAEESKNPADEETLSSDPPPPPTSQVPDPQENPVEDSPSVSKESSPPTSPGKRKASSLGDLTSLERGAKRTSDPSAILERAVSMDLQQQQSIPGENLTKQKKILRTPAFEDDCDEDGEGDDAEGGGLKRWDGGLDKVLTVMTNGHVKIEDELVGDEIVIIPSGEEKEATSTGEKTNLPSTDNATPPKNLLTLDLDLDSSGSETTLQDIQDKLLTSTPGRKLIEVKDFLKDDDVSLDDVPYLASAKHDDDAKQSVRTSSSSTSGQSFSPVTISIPIIKPDMTNYEKLPSPPPASTHPAALDASWRVTKTTVEHPLDRISVQSLYRPIFTSKENDDSEVAINGNDSDVSEHYSTAQESSADTSALSVTLSSSPTTTTNNNVSIKTPNNAAGFAKTLIIPGPNEVESLLSLAAEPNTPPPQSMPKPIETE